MHLTYVLLLALCSFCLTAQSSSNASSGGQENSRTNTLVKKRRIRQDSCTDFHLVQFDFEKPDLIVYPKNLRRGDFYQIRVTNVNLNNYSIVTTNQDTVYANNIKFPAFGVLDLSAVSSLVQGLQASYQLLPSTELADFTVFSANSKKYAIADEATIKTIRDRPGLLTSIIATNQLDTSFVDLDSLASANSSSKFFDIDRNEVLTNAEENDLLDNVSDRRIGITSDLSLPALEPSPEDEIKDQVGSVTDSTKNFLEELASHKVTIEQKLTNYVTYRTMVYTSKEVPDGRFSDVTAEIEQFNTLRLELAALGERIEGVSKSYQTFISSPAITVVLKKDINAFLKATADKATVALAEVTKATNKTRETISLETISKTLVQLHSLDNKYTYTSLPIQYTGSQTRLDIRFVPTDTSYNFPTKYLPPMNFPVRNTCWSVGSSIYFSKFDNERVVISSTMVDTVPSYSVQSEEPLNTEMGLALLLRGGTKVKGSSFGLHLTAGTGLSLGEVVRPRALLGGGITLGREHSFALDLGTVAGYATVVSPAFTEDMKFAEAPQPLINEFRVRLFFSLGYAYTF
ncbi:hypothetical protein [Neolewinella sp.]|uniref:hypothetical protein n=1 Tax=Neolewinella sp. TaxID=2993543 RepID=UPI003B51EBCD